MGKEKMRISDLKRESEARLGNHGLYSSRPFTLHIFKGLQINPRLIWRSKNRKGHFSTLWGENQLSLTPLKR